MAFVTKNGDFYFFFAYRNKLFMNMKLLIKNYLDLPPCCFTTEYEYF